MILYIGTKEHPTYKVIERCDFVVSEVLRQGKDEVSCCDILDLSRPALAKKNLRREWSSYLEDVILKIIVLENYNYCYKLCSKAPVI